MIFLRYVVSIVDIVKLRLTSEQDSTWFQAINALKALAQALQFHEGKEFERAYETWLACAPGLVVVFMEHPWISLPDVTAVNEEPHNHFRVLCLVSIYPFLSGFRATDTSFVSAISQFCRQII